MLHRDPYDNDDMEENRHANHLPILGLAGERNSGKDTVFYRLSTLLPSKSLVRVAFGDLLKDSACALFNITREELELLKNDEDKTFVTLHNGTALNMRMTLIRYGSQAHRDVFGNDFWIRMAMEKIQRLRSENPESMIVITDVRFDNEAETIIKMGGKVVTIKGPDREPVRDEHGNVVPGEDGISPRFVSGTIDNSIRTLLDNGEPDYSRLDKTLHSTIGALGL